MTTGFVWLLATMLASVCILGCGDGGRGRTNAYVRYSAPQESGHVFGDDDADEYESGRSDDDNDDNERKDGDNDLDNAKGGYFDRDDRALLDFGHAASPSERRAIAGVVVRYARAAAALDGPVACSLLAAPFSGGVVETLGRPPGPPYYSGRTCAQVMTRVFAMNVRQMRAYAVLLRPVVVRVHGDVGVVIVSFEPRPGRELRMVRERGVWRVDALVPRELP